MLHRCVATNRCCPKLHEDELGVEAMSRSTHMYNNAYMHEELAHSSALHGMEDGSDFPPGALALMYDPPTTDWDDISEDWGQGADDVSSAPELMSSPSKGASLRGNALQREGSPGPLAFAVLSPGGGLRGGWAIAPSSSLPSDSVGDEGFASSTRSPSTPRLVAPSRPRGAGPAPRGWGAHAGDLGSATCQPLASGDVASRATRPAAPPRTTCDFSSHAVGVQQRSLSRSFRDAQSCTSEVGAASIAAIMQCVAQAKDLPLQQRPNSQKWAERWAAYHLEKHVM